MIAPVLGAPIDLAGISGGPYTVALTGVAVYYLALTGREVIPTVALTGCHAFCQGF